MNNEEIKKLALDLFQAENEDSVEKILSKNNLWAEKNWHPLGDNENNYSIIGNQRRGKLLIEKSQDVNTALTDNDYGREVERSHLVGPMGSKYMNKFMDTDTDQNDINDSDRSYGN